MWFIKDCMLLSLCRTSSRATTTGSILLKFCLGFNVQVYHIKINISTQEPWKSIPGLGVDLIQKERDELIIKEALKAVKNVSLRYQTTLHKQRNQHYLKHLSIFLGRG